MPAPAVAPSARFSFDVCSGRLYRTTNAEVVVMLPWPMMKAFRWTRPTGAPKACTPEFAVPPDLPSQLGRMDTKPDDTRPTGVDVNYDGLTEILAFCRATPESVRRAVSPFRERHWQLLTWIASTGPAAEQLLLASPALAFAVACGAELTVQEAPIRFIEKRSLMAYHGQVDLLARLGFPATERTRRTLRKVPASAVSLQRLHRLREWLHDEGIVRRLAHVPNVNNSVLALLENGAFAAVSDAALHQLARAPDTDARDVPGHLAEAIGLWGLVRPTTALPQFTRLEHVRAIHQELRQDARKVRRNMGLFPPAPVPGTGHIVHIDSMAMLIEESRVQSNCVDTYAGSIRKGSLAVYRVL